MEFLAPYQGYLMAALAVAALLIAVMVVLKAVGGRVRARQGSRLGVSEYREIDKLRRLVLVRRDGVEHLLMIGGAQDLLIETGIGADIESRPVRPRYEETLEERQPVIVPRPEPAPPPIRQPVQLRAAPRPAVFGDRAPEAPAIRRAEPRLEPVKRPEEDAGD